LLVGQDLFHVFVLFDCPETKLAMKQIGDFLIRVSNSCLE